MTVSLNASVSQKAASSANPVMLCEENDNRTGAIIFNNASSALYVLYGSTSGVVSSANFTDKIAAGGKLEEDDFLGEITGIWDANPNGNAQVSILT